MTVSNAILVINAGSSSLKFSVFRENSGGDLAVTINGQISGIGTEPVFEAKDPAKKLLGEKAWGPGEKSDRTALLGFLLEWINANLDGAKLIAAGHRVVHGGSEYSQPVLLTPKVLADLEALVPLAPLHQPSNLAAIRALAEAHPELPQVGCFDTAFHRGQPWQMQTFALPRAMTEEGIRRYGFHGLSYEYIAQRLPEVAPELAGAHVVVCHLGSGASMCALHAGKSVESTMGFTAVDGLPMGTRPGRLDAGVLIYLMRKGMGADELEKLLYHKSGLLGVSGVSNDMRVLLESDNPHAAEAVELFCHSVARETGGLAASMEGLDAIVFTAGIGERSSPVRSRVAKKLAWMGVKLDEAANKANALKISAADSSIPVFVIPTDEERMIAQHTIRVMGAQ